MLNIQTYNFNKMVLCIIHVYLFVFVIWVRVDICVVGMYVFGGVLWWLCLHVESLGIIYIHVVLYHIKQNFHQKPGHSRPQPFALGVVLVCWPYTWYSSWNSEMVFRHPESCIGCRSASWESVRTLLRITRPGNRKSYLVIICPNSHKKLTKVN